MDACALVFEIDPNEAPAIRAAFEAGTLWGRALDPSCELVIAPTSDAAAVFGPYPEYYGHSWPPGDIHHACAGADYDAIAAALADDGAGWVQQERATP